MSIVEAKKELYNQLRNNQAVRGAGIREKNGAEYIVIYLTEPKFASKVPTTYKGNKVVTEVSSAPRAL